MIYYAQINAIKQFCLVFCLCDFGFDRIDNVAQVISAIEDDVINGLGRSFLISWMGDVSDLRKRSLE